MTKKNDRIQKLKQDSSLPSVDLMAFEAQQQLFHKLKIHRMPHETQNEELIRMQAELYAANVRFFNFFDQTPVGCLSVSENGFIMDANLTACNMLGVDRGALIKQAITSFIHPKDQNIYYQYHNHILDDGDQQTCELQMLKRSGTTFWTRLEATVKQNAVGIKECFITIDDIYKSEIKDYEHELMESFIRLTSAPGDFHEHMSNLISSLQQWSGCEAVGVRLRDKNDYPYFETHGFLPEFITMENYLAVHDKSGKTVCDDTGKPMLECMCGNILSGRFDPVKPFFTANGSFWSNNTTALLADTTDSDSQAHTCKRCNAEGYESVALIPLRVNDKVVGLLQFNDHSQNRFTTDMIGYLEKMANSLAIVMSRHQIDEALLASENRYRCIIDGLTDYHYHVHMKNNNDVHAIHNPDCEKVTGYTVDEFTANPDIWIQMVAQEERDIVTAHMQRILKGINFPPIEHRIIRKDGETRWVRNTAILNKDESGNLMSYDGLIQDITEHKREEENLRRFATVLQDSNDAIIIQNFDGNIITWNSGAELMLGYSKTEALTMNIEHIIVPDKVEEYKNFIQRLLSDEKIISQESQRLTKDKRVIDVWLTITKMVGSDGKSIGITSTMRDITEQKRTEEHVHDMKVLNRTVLNSVMENIAVVDKHGTIIFVNEGWERFTLDNGFDPQSPNMGVGANYLEVCERAIMNPGDEADMILNGIKAVLTRSQATFKHEYSCDSPTEKRWFFMQVSYLNQADGGAVIGHLNITESKQTEHALLESKNHLQALTTNLPNVVLYQLVLDSKGFRQFTYISDAIYDINEVTVEEVMTNPNVLYSQVLPEYLPGLIAAENIAVSKNSTFNYEFECLLPSGKTRWFELFASIRTQLNGNSISEGVQIDITERKQAEVDKVKLENQLMQAQKMESVGRLAGGVAHDFNNMLQVILGNTSLAIKKAPKGSSMLKNLKEINDSANRSANLTRQLLAFARKQTIIPIVLDMNEVVEGILKMLKRLIGEDIDIEWIPGADIFPIKVDPTQIDQILANLCVNARDAITDTGKITIKTDNSLFDMDYCETHAGYIPGEYVSLSISDTGCGMDKETLQHIFEPFFTTKGVGKGTGLGLSTVYGAIKQNKGYVNVCSEKEMGTTFTIFLPRYAGKIIQTQMEDEDMTNLCGKETVLVVEDEPSILEMITEMLQDNGYNTLAADNPVEAIRLVEEYTNEINLLLTDVVMPNMNGSNLSKHLLMLHPNLKCLFMSGYTSDIIANYGIMNEGLNFIHKPFSMIELTTKIREVLIEE